jgi:CheY-like chemotaxis protein
VGADVARVLVVDDEPEVRCSSRRLLELDGHDVVEAADAHQAMRLLQEFEPDAVLLDIRLPGMNGWELLDALRENGRVRHTVVIIASADPGPGSTERALALGCRACLAKPFTLEQLRGALAG